MIINKFIKLEKHPRLDKVAVIEFKDAEPEKGTIFQSIEDDIVRVTISKETLKKLAKCINALANKL